MARHKFNVGARVRVASPGEGTSEKWRERDGAVVRLNSGAWPSPAYTVRIGGVDVLMFESELVAAKGGAA